MKNKRIVLEDGVGFEISPDGEYVLDLNTLKIRKQSACKKGYKRVWSTGAFGTRRSFLVHRLVALAFLDCPDGYQKMDVNHIDANKSNNHFGNLEWVTHQENMAHGKKLKLFKPGPGRGHKVHGK